MKKNIIFLIVFLILGIATSYYIYSTYKETSPEKETKIELPDSGVSEEWMDNFIEK